MPTIRRRTVFTAGVPSGAGLYPITGSQYEYLPFDAEVEFAVVATPTEDTDVGVANIEASIYSGSDVLQQQDAVTVKPIGALAAPISRRDDFLVSDVAAAGERISVELSSPPADATSNGIVETCVIITPA